MAARPDTHVQAAGLTSLSAILGADAFDDLLTALASDDPQIRITARRLAANADRLNSLMGLQSAAKQ